jgi:signal transduction histidine kinase
MSDHPLPAPAPRTGLLARYPASRLRRFLRSFRVRLTLYFVAILAVVLAGFSIFIYTRQAQVLRVETANQLGEQSSLLAGYFSNLLAQPYENDNEKPVGVVPRSNLPILQGTEVLVLVGPDGTVLQQMGARSSADLSSILASWKAKPDAAIYLSSGSEAGHGYLFQVTALSHDRLDLGALVLGSPVDASNQMGRLALTLGLSAALILLLAFGGGYWLADRAMKPVHYITHTARQISESDLSRRLRLNRDDELGELAGTFDQMLDRVQGAFERQRQFTADASHELRTPLAIIELETNRALERPRSARDYEHALQTIQSENEWMSRLVNELLLLARLDAGQVALQAERLDLAELALDVVDRLGPVARSRGVALDTGQLGEAGVRAGRVYLASVINNLVENAIKYAQGQGARVLVETGCQARRGQDWAWVRVSDNGPGIPPEHLPHLFDRFYQIDPARSRDAQEPDRAAGVSLPGDADSPVTINSGSGLGLAIVKTIVEAYGGMVEAASEDGRGATFTAWLPANEL